MLRNLEELVSVNLLKLISLCLLLVCSEVAADFKDWNKTDKVLFGTYVGLNVIDVGQTFDIIHCQKYNPSCGWVEKNKLVGTHPSVKEVLILKVIGTGIIYYTLDRVLHEDEKARRRALLIINGIALHTVVHNKQIGLQFRFSF
mgnify:FL=1